MVKLEAKETILGGIFYFHNMKDCNDFLYVFTDHWCNVPWKNPVEAPNFPEIEKYQRKAMDIDPKQRAENSLSWGFRYVKSHNIGLTNVQKAFVNGITIINN